MGFSQEGQILSEIKLLFMQIFGRLEFIKQIANHVKTNETPTDDPSWVEEMGKIKEYNSRLLGACVWDLVCKWNHDIKLVKSWMARYDDEECKKYSTDFQSTWNSNIEKLNPYIGTFDKCGLLDINLQSQAITYEKKIKTENQKIQSICDASIITLNTRISVLESECTQKKNEITNLKIDNKQHEDSAALLLKTNNTRVSDLTHELKISRDECDVKDLEIVNYAKQLSENTKEITTITQKITEQEQNITALTTNIDNLLKTNNTRVSALTHELKKKAKQLSENKKKISTITEKITEKEQNITVLTTEIQNLSKINNTRVSELTDELKISHDKFNAKDAELAENQKKITTITEKNTEQDKTVAALAAELAENQKNLAKVVDLCHSSVNHLVAELDQKNKI